jgi:uncharacterized membrane protein
MKAFFARIAPAAILALSFCGLADSAYLAQNELAGTPLLCNVTGLSGCNIVAESAYSHLFGVPIAVYGLAFYALLFVLAALEAAFPSHALRKSIQLLALFGVLVSLASLFVQLFLIGALCMYCAFSWLLTLVAGLFSLALSGFFRPPPHLTEPHS